MIKLHREEFEKELKAFEEGLYIRFKKQFDLNVSFFRRLSDVIDEKMNEIEPKTNFEWAITFLFYRSYRLYWTILILCKDGFGPEASILVRSLMEHAVTMDWIAKENPNQRAKLFLEYFHVARKKLYDKYEKYLVFERLADVEKKQIESREEVKRFHKEVKDQYRDDCFWAPESIRSRAQELHEGYDWDFYYWYFSFFVHPNSVSQLEYLRPAEPKDIFVVGPSERMIEDVFHLSYKYLLRAFNRWNVVFKLGQDKLVLNLLEKLDNISFIRQE
jgi:hypothetical protein